MTSPAIPPAIEAAELIWRDGLPESKQIEDICSDLRNGRLESGDEFIERYNLIEQFAAVPEAGSFVVAKAGFGTGLTFLTTWQAWQAHGPSHAATLHFVAAEPSPLSRRDLESALTAWPELQSLSKELISNYPPLIQGTHRLILDGGRIRLTLFFGDINTAWDQLDFQADVWLGDNPKVPESSVTRDTTETPANSVAVIGAGIAGCLLANNLARRGYSVTLVDAADEAGSAASGNLQGAMYVKLGVEFNHQTQLALSSLTFSQRYYAPYLDQYWHPTGLLQLAWNDNEKDRQRRFIERNRYPEEVLRAVTRQEAETLTGSSLESGGLWFPSSGWLSPGKLCRSLASHPGIRKVFGLSVRQLVASEGKWLLSATDSEDIRADQVVICAGHLSPKLIPGQGTFRFKAIRGQVTHIPASLVTNPKAVICGARYFNPAQGAESEQLAVIGATFDLHSDEPAPTAASHRENIRDLSAMVPQMLSAEIASGNLPDQLAGRVGFRCTTHDYQPVAGPFFDASGQVQEGLYLLTGLGSKGLTYAPLLAEFVADLLTDQPSALPAQLAKRVATGRMHRTKVASS
ncbi:FAD-dependent 5-carboxymethylaminomethyl-2-thiouridine(34) oxidoreductase MnmC [Marinobacter sp. 2_MG-2023]|uniref:FAD-dependent 5-carboxymethylaminomethyl-2-thiouridine(34) oxidoreductase MnmC n=1 Tax=Marinobacter sp. 2_MG-2023 TaxID=3062679 RepID=UPI0026E29811|nr:FAD-dependent 5-carboxymethylaminomethyl-2-thiouridine(34) oxidoreductase MnmC [Marinobacter sp. 2_MG-2023]MDO6442179.1 FAD-dependent 5-carboxymethylaminomethyl-2-thiouridine(34) oxidoreductase MnmC [Marinobacter sp. 2_MG-2023]